MRGRRKPPYARAPNKMTTRALAGTLDFTPRALAARREAISNLGSSRVLKEASSSNNQRGSSITSATSRRDIALDKQAARRHTVPKPGSVCRPCHSNGGIALLTTSVARRGPHEADGESPENPFLPHRYPPRRSCLPGTFDRRNKHWGGVRRSTYELARVSGISDETHELFDRPPRAG